MAAVVAAICRLVRKITELERAVETSRAEHTAALGLATARIRELEDERTGRLGNIRELCEAAEARERELEGERDELLGLLQYATVDDCANWRREPSGHGIRMCQESKPCAEHRRRAIVARIEKATKGGS